LFVILTLMLGFGNKTTAQSCNFQFIISDNASAQDGWDGCRIRIRYGARTLDTTMIAGLDTSRFTLAINRGDSIVVTFYSATGGFIFFNEIKARLVDRNGDILFSMNPAPTLPYNSSELIYEGVASCSSCRPPKNPVVTKVNGNVFVGQFADLRWNASVSNPANYKILYRPASQPLGGLIATFTDTVGRISGLAEGTDYVAYVYSSCATDSSFLVGPVKFKTFRANDVGISGMTNPKSKCNLGTENIYAIFKNFGTNPQELLPYYYSVNGRVYGIGNPLDSVFTGVLSKDSSASFMLNTPINFATSGEYNIAIWTYLPGDSNKANDTFRTTITSVRTVNQYPYFVNYENGKDTWSKVDSSALLGANSWEFGTPRSRFINTAASGRNVWTTSLDTSYNTNEFSYVYSPCFDFSSQGADPRISFNYNVYTPAGDGSFLESSIDGGSTWRRVGTRNTGINWYNDTSFTTRVGAIWDGTANAGWRLAQNTLTGMALQSNVRLRFGFRSSTFTNVANFDGFAFDNVLVAPRTAIDMASSAAQHTNTSDCGSATDSVQIKITNVGETARSTFVVSYRYDNNPIVNENVTININPNATYTYRFATTINSTTPGAHNLTVWVKDAADAIAQNDSITASFTTPRGASAPLLFNFNDNLTPAGWATAGSVFPGTGHGALSPALYANMWSSNQQYQAITNKWGPISTRDSLYYDYRIVNENSPYNAWSFATNLNNDKFYVSAAFDCDTTFTVIDSINATNQMMSANLQTRKISLAAFAGRAIKVKFRLTSTINTFVGYYFDLDNINYVGCLQTFNIRGFVRPASNTPGANNGYISGVFPSAGLPPFTYAWSAGPGTPPITGRDSIGGLRPGTYTVTITDAKGCTDIKAFTVGVTATFEAKSAIGSVKISPNPTSGITLVDVEYNGAVDAQVQIFNLVGQQLYQIQSKQSSKERYTLDMSTYPAGMYLVRVTAENKSYTAKVVKQ
jgi:hypothetical protein